MWGENGAYPMLAPSCALEAVRMTEVGAPVVRGMGVPRTDKRKTQPLGQRQI